MNNKTVLVGSGVFGLLAGFAVITGALNIKSVSVAGLLALPVGFVCHLTTEATTQKRVRELDEKYLKTIRELDTADKKLVFLADTEAHNKHLNAELNKVRIALDIATQEYQKAYDLSQYLQTQLSALERQVSASKEEIEELQAEVEEWQIEFNKRLNAAVEEKFLAAQKTEIQKNWETHNQITRDAMTLLEDYQSAARELSDRFAHNNEGIAETRTAYRQHLIDFKNQAIRERDDLLNHIDLLNQKVAQLQHELAGDLVEPEYGQFGFDQNGRIANAIAEWLWNHHKIPLKVTGFEVSGDVLTAGYTYPRSMPLEALVKQVDGDSSQIARSLGLYAIEKPHKLEIADVFTVKIRRERPARKADKGSLYRSSEEFVKYVLSQPVRLRIVGEPGSGKTPSTTVLLGHILKRGFLEANTPNGRKLPYCVVESCNPLAGISVKNGDELDFCLCWNDGKKGFKGLAEEYRFRKNPVNADYKNQVGYIWVADEIDVTMADLTKDEAKPFKDALKDGGHINLGVIVMGQSANVSTSKGLSIDDQKMLTNIYIDSVSIRTFLTPYGERFYSKRAVEKALATLEELELEIEEKNEVICDTAREFRISMVTASRSPVFYQLPYFDSVEIDVNAYQETLAKVSVIRDRRPKTGVVDSVSPDSERFRHSSSFNASRRVATFPLCGFRDGSDKPACPHCKSDRVRSKGDSWLCQNPDHYLLANGTPKSWKK